MQYIWFILGGLATVCTLYYVRRTSYASARPKMARYLKLNAEYQKKSKLANKLMLEVEDKTPELQAAYQQAVAEMYGKDLN